jgi:hypothetical protein
MEVDSVKLMYCVEELLPVSLEYAKVHWGVDVDTSETVLSIGPKSYGLFAPDDPRLHTFDGTITAIDDESDDVFVAVSNSDGEEREFDRVGPAADYRIGGRMIVRFLEAGRTSRNEQIANVVEVWLE